MLCNNGRVSTLPFLFGYQVDNLGTVNQREKSLGRADAARHGACGLMCENRGTETGAASPQTSVAPPRSPQRGRRGREGRRGEPYRAGSTKKEAPHQSGELQYRGTDTACAVECLRTRQPASHLHNSTGRTGCQAPRRQQRSAAVKGGS